MIPRTCTDCRCSKPLADFNRRTGRTENARMSVCRDCSRKRWRLWKAGLSSARNAEPGAPIRQNVPPKRILPMGSVTANVALGWTI